MARLSSPSPRISPALGDSRFILYPVLSRRSGGLSLGIDLFPDRKVCSFDCPYCEVFPFEGPRPFALDALDRELEQFASERDSGFRGEPIRDLCLAGSGEPTLSPFFIPALKLLARARRRHPECYGQAELVLITNATGFLRPTIVDFLHPFVRDEGLRIWSKLDAGGESLYRRMARIGPAFTDLVAGILAFARKSPIVIQTMICALRDRLEDPALPPPDEETLAYAGLLLGLLRKGAGIREIQLYTQARPAHTGLTLPVSDTELLRRAAMVEAALSEGNIVPPIKVYGEMAELAFGNHR